MALHHDRRHHRPGHAEGHRLAKALRAALADNPFVKGEGMPVKARRELLGHSQLTLDFD